ncbi:MAG: hypothetical protein RR909_03390 [Bacilli bacterium]
MKIKYLSTVCLLSTLLFSCGNGSDLIDSNLTATLNSEFKYKRIFETNWWNEKDGKNYYFEKSKDQVILEFKTYDKELLGVYFKTSYVEKMLSKLNESSSGDRLVFYEKLTESASNSLDILEKKNTIKYVNAKTIESFPFQTGEYTLGKICTTRDVIVTKNDKTITKKIIGNSTYAVTTNGIVQKDLNTYEKNAIGKFSYVDAPGEDSHLKLENSFLTCGENGFYYDFNSHALPIINYKGKDCIKIVDILYSNYSNYEEIKAIINKSKIGTEVESDITFSYLDVTKF